MLARVPTWRDRTRLEKNIVHRIDESWRMVKHEVSKKKKENGAQISSKGFRCFLGILSLFFLFFIFFFSFVVSLKDSCEMHASDTQTGGLGKRMGLWQQNNEYAPNV